MTWGSRRLFLRAAAIASVCLVSIVAVTGQAAVGQSPAPPAPMSQDVFKSAAVLRNIPPDTFLEAMGMFANSMGADCTFCHVREAFFDRAKFAVPTPTLNRARQMVLMMNSINQTYFGGERRVTCFTCHGGSDRPPREPNLSLQYSTPPEDPNALDLPPETSVTADQLFDKYLQVIGGRDRLGRISSLVASGTYEGFDTGATEVPVDIYAKAPNQRTVVVHMMNGTSIRVFDGRNGWLAGPDTLLPLVRLTTGNLARARLEAMLMFPTGIRDAFSTWNVGSSIIDDNDVVVVQGSDGGQPLTNLYFDEDGFLVRLVRYTETPVGRVPTQVDYANYRDVSGVKIPFEYTVSQTFLRGTVRIKEVKLNAAVDAARFAAPAAYSGPR